MTPEPELLPAGKVAARLGVTRQTVHTWARKGLLPGTRLPSGVWRFREQDVAAFQQVNVEPSAPRPREAESDSAATADAS